MKVFKCVVFSIINIVGNEPTFLITNNIYYEKAKQLLWNYAAEDEDFGKSIKL